MLKLTASKNLDDPRFVYLYRSAFPPDEHIPEWKLKNLLGHGGRLVIFTDADVFVGFCLTFETDGILYIAYIAISPGLRSRGYGSDLLDAVVSEKNYRGCFLTAECLEGSGDELKRRSNRRRFYRKNGWKQSGVKIMTCGTDLEVYELDTHLSKDEVMGIIRRFYDALDGLYYN